MSDAAVLTRAELVAQQAAARAEKAAAKAAHAAAKQQPAGKRRRGVATPAIDAAWHTDPDTPAPRWTKALEAEFLQALYDGRGSLKFACQATGVPYRAAVARLEGEAAEGSFAERCGLVQRLYQDRVYEEFQDRVLTDKARPANIIFQMKSRDARYAEVRKPERVTFNIALTDPTFRKAPTPIDVTVTKALSA